MSAASPSSLYNPVQFTDCDFHRVRERLQRLTGIALSPAHRERVYRRLAHRLRALGLTDFDTYLRRLDDADCQRERTHFVNALTTNFTAFFREPTHFDFFSGTVLARASQRGQPRLRVWSAGCSTGEEAYSLAVLTAGALPGHGRCDASILATDLDSRAIAIARRGGYAPESVPGMPPAQRARLFAPVPGDDRRLLKVRREIRRLVTFRQMNLLHDWSMTTLFDAIFCRNVMMYFDSATRHRLLDRFADRLRQGGYLFIGCSESVCGLTSRFEVVDKAVYRKLR